MSLPEALHHYAIAIPARNEATRIARCLDACRVTMSRIAKPGIIALLVNNTSDETAECARAWARESAIPLRIKEVHFPSRVAHAGSARRAALDLARSLVGDDGLLLTTDADSRPLPDWVEANLTPLTDGTAKLVCGTFDLEEDEYAQLPAEITERGAIEDRYLRLSLELANLLDPDAINQWPFHGQASGASLAITAAAYDKIGGAPVVPNAEDRALLQLCVENDLPVLYSDTARVITSCRLDGRASGGMADTIAGRVAGGEHICDEMVEPARMVWVRAETRARLRSVFNHPRDRIAIFEELKRGGQEECNVPIFTGFGALWAFVERTSPQLKRRRMLWEEMAAELPLLEELCNRARTQADMKHAPISQELIA